MGTAIFASFSLAGPGGLIGNCIERTRVNCTTCCPPGPASQFAGNQSTTNSNSFLDEGLPRGATSVAPISVLTTNPIESVVDMELTSLAPRLTFSHSRTLSWIDGVGEPISTTHDTTDWWSNTDGLRLKLLNSDKFELYIDGRTPWQFYVPTTGVPEEGPADSFLVLEYNAGDSEYVLTNVVTGYVWTFHHALDGNDEPLPLHGRLKECTTREWKKLGLDGFIYEYDSVFRVEDVFFPEGDNREAAFDYEGSGADAKLSSIVVSNGSYEIQRVDYGYGVGSDTDDIFVIYRTRTSNNGPTSTTEWDIRYRFSSAIELGGTPSGFAIWEHDAVMRAASGLGVNPAALINRPHADVVTYATKYFRTGLTLNQNDIDAIKNAYGLVIDAQGAAVVDEELVNTNASCCGGDTSQLQRRYYKFFNSEGPIKQVLVEDILESGNPTPVRRRVYGINDDGVELLSVLIDAPLSGSPKFWCSTFVYDTDLERYTARRYPSAHVDVVSNAGLDDLIDDPYAKVKSGLVQHYEYTAEGYLSGIRDRKGGVNASDQYLNQAYYSWGVEYGGTGGNTDPEYLIVKEYQFNDPLTTKSGPATTVDYGYWDNATKTEIKWIKKYSPPITSGSGANAQIVTEMYFDRAGRKRWTKDGEGYVNYYSYDKITGNLAVIGKDVPDDADPAPAPAGTWLPWTDADANLNTPNRTGSIAPRSLVTKSEYDSQGRVVLVTQPDEKIHKTRYLVLAQADYRYFDNGTGKPAVPFRLLKFNSQDFLAETIYIDPAHANANNATGYTAGTAQTDYARWTRFQYDPLNGRLKFVDAYKLMPNTGVGSLHVNYDRSAYLYDAQGRTSGRLRSKADGQWQGSAYEFDAISRVTKVNIGFGDSDGTYLPAEVHRLDTQGRETNRSQAFQYDFGGVGDGYLTASLNYFGLNDTNNFGMSYHFDHRGNRRGSASMYNVDGVDSDSEPTGSTRWSYITDYDWQGRPTAHVRTPGAVTWDNVLADENYIANNNAARYEHKRLYRDVLGRPYKYENYDTSVVTPDKKFVTDYFYDRRGLVVGVAPRHTAGVEYAYDGLGRQYQERRAASLNGTYTSGLYDYKAPAPVADASSQSSSPAFGTGGDQYIAAIVHDVFEPMSSRVIERHTFQDAGSPNGLNLSGGDHLRTSVYRWYDEAERITGIADYGSGDADANGPGNWKLTTNPPVRPNSVPFGLGDPRDLVVKYTYDAKNGRLKSKNDDWTTPSRHDSYSFDSLGRLVYHDDFDVETIRLYDGLGNLATQGQKSSGSGDPYQHTDYFYSENRKMRGWLPSQVKYPGSTYNYVYTRAGELQDRTDPRGTKIRRSYASYGEGRKVTWERAITIGSNTIANTRAIQRFYDGKGRNYVIRSYSDVNGGSSNVMNDIRHQFSNRFDQLVKSYQSHEGIYNATSGWQTSTPSVWYSYNPAINGDREFVNHLRLGWLMYPSGRTDASANLNYATHRNRIIYNYGAADSFDDRLGRVSREKNSFESVDKSSFKWISRHFYTGTDRRIKLILDQPGVDLSAGAGANFFNLDRYGRSKSQVWKKGSVEKDRYDYHFNRLEVSSYGTYMMDLESRKVGASLNAPSSLDQYYENDENHRLTRMEDHTGATVKTWDLDGLGNWDSVVEGGATETRQHDDNNRLTSINGTALQYAGDLIKKAPDPTGNTTGAEYQYDAWNRLVLIDFDDDHRFSFEYDGLHRRIVKADHDGDSEHYYYDKNWRVLEVRKNTSTTPSELYQWHPDHLDSLAVRYHDSNEDGQFTGNEVQYVMQDANYNVTALMNSSGTVLERYHYDPYGTPTILDPDFTPNTGDTYASPYLFTGRRYDYGTGLYQYRFRHYDSNLGRFLEIDPIGYLGGPNQFAYVGNMPNVYLDPLGLEAWPGGWWNPGNWVRGVYTGDARADDSVYDAAKEAAGGVYTQNAGNFHTQMEIADHWDPTGLVDQTDQVVRYFEGPELSDEVMKHTDPRWEKARDISELASQINMVRNMRKTCTTKLGSSAGDFLDDAGDQVKKNSKKKKRIGKKRGPKPKDQGGPHNDKIGEVADRMEKEGYTITEGGNRLPEKLRKTPGGKKSGRRPDIVGTKGGKEKAVNVGKVRKDGTPIKREADALDDLRGTGLDIDFEPYNNN